MKFAKYITVVFSAITLFSCQPAHAQITDMDMCQAQARLAKTIMSVRQQGSPMHEVMQRNADIKNEFARTVHGILVKLAYEEPLYGSKEFKDRSANEFATTIFKACLKSTARS
jgi:D-lyxose ketol-isomerase